MMNEARLEELKEDSESTFSNDMDPNKVLCGLTVAQARELFKSLTEVRYMIQSNLFFGDCAYDLRDDLTALLGITNDDR